MPQRRVIITQYEGLYYRLEFEQRADGRRPADPEWTKEWANVVAHENRIERYVSDYIQAGIVRRGVQ